MGLKKKTSTDSLGTFRLGYLEGSLWLACLEDVSIECVYVDMSVHKR